MQLTCLGFVIWMSGLPKATAGELCDRYRSDNPYLYKLYCSNESASTKPAGANSTFNNSFNINSASLPTEPSSYGVETIVSFLRDNPSTIGENFALIKGFHRFGTGISTSSNNTFYGNDVIQRLQGPSQVDSFKLHEPAKGKFTNLNLGTSLELYSPARGPHVRLGISVRYNNVTNTWGMGPGLLLSWNKFTIGGGYTYERVSNQLPYLYFGSLLFSTRISLFELEYNLLISDINGTLNLPQELQLSPIHIWTLTARIHRLTLTGALRFLNYVSEGSVTQAHFALQYMFSKHFSAGLLYNYIPGANSIGAQIYL